MSDPRDYKVELSSGESSAGAQSPESSTRPYLGIQFDCCGVYQRIYRDASGSAYRGRCPRCGKTVNFPVGQGGTASRFFVVR